MYRRLARLKRSTFYLLAVIAAAAVSSVMATQHATAETPEAPISIPDEQVLPSPSPPPSTSTPVAGAPESPPPESAPPETIANESAPPSAPPAPSQEIDLNEWIDRDFVIQTQGDQLAFDPPRIRVTVNQYVQVTFKNTASVASELVHNWVLVQPGKIPEVGAFGLNAGMAPGDEMYDPYVLASTRTLKPGESTSVAFQAPEEPGDYPFIPSIGDQWRTMRGILRVEPIG